MSPKPASVESNSGVIHSGKFPSQACCLRIAQHFLAFQDRNRRNNIIGVRIKPENVWQVSTFHIALYSLTHSQDLGCGLSDLHLRNNYPGRTSARSATVRR